MPEQNDKYQHNLEVALRKAEAQLVNDLVGIEAISMNDEQLAKLQQLFMLAKGYSEVQAAQRILLVKRYKINAKVLTRGTENNPSAGFASWPYEIDPDLVDRIISEMPDMNVDLKNDLLNKKKR